MGIACVGPSTYRSGGRLIWTGLEVRKEELEVHLQKWGMENSDSQSGECSPQVLGSHKCQAKDLGLHLEGGVGVSGHRRV